ncbi:MAG TPA: hypothetical protein VK486_15845 [Thermoleophilaceae bacterium]|nr:hypothetical protein [Thermoleophilaceae bacterium]
MGLLSRLNRSGNEVLSPTVVDPGFKRADSALERGSAARATIVGIEQKLDDGTVTRFVAVAVSTPSGTRTGGVQVGHGPAQALARLRLGVEVLVRHSDGDAVVLDWPAMCALWGVAGEPAQKRRRKPPGDGVTDKAVDWSDQRRLKKWTPRRAMITALSRRDGVIGPTMNFDVSLRLEDGAQAVAGNTEIPFYGAWLATPGAEVPVAVDPKDLTKAVVDWAAAANEPSRSPGRLNDPPPDGSAAALLAPG